MRRVQWIGLALAGLVPASADGQTVDEIVARHLAARGGAAKIAAVESLRMTGKARGPEGREAIVVREVKRPGRLRLEFTSQGVTGVYAYDGARGWRVSPFDGQLEPGPMPPEGTQAAVEQADIGGPLVDWKAKGHRLELLGREPLGDGEAWKLRLTLANGEVRHVYLDARTHLQVRTEATREVRGRRLEMETTFGDYRDTDGILFPRSIEVAVKGRPARLRIRIDRVEINPPLDEARFRMPDGSH